MNTIKICMIVVFILMVTGSYAFVNFCIGKPLVASAADTLRPVIFGPYIALDGGEYEVTYTIESVHRLNDQVAVLEVVSDNGRNVYVAKTISDEDFKEVGAIESFKMVFKSSGDIGIEFRVKSIEGTDLDVQEIAVTKIKKWSQLEIIGNKMIRGATDDSTIAQSEGSLGEGVVKKYRVGSGLYKYVPPPASTLKANDLYVNKVLRMAKKLWGRLGGFPIPQVSNLKVNDLYVNKVSRIEQKLWEITSSFLYPLLLVLIILSGLLMILARVFRMKNKRIKTSVVVIILSWIIASIIFEAIGGEGFKVEVGILIATYLIFNLILGINPRLPMGIAAFFFAFCSILMIRSDARAETMAVYAYVFLVVGVGTHAAESVLGVVFSKIRTIVDVAMLPDSLELEADMIRKVDITENGNIEVPTYSRIRRLENRRWQERRKIAGIILAASIVIMSGFSTFRIIVQAKSLNPFVKLDQGSIQVQQEADKNVPGADKDPEKKLSRIAVADGTGGDIGAGIVKELHGRGFDSVYITDAIELDLSKTTIRCKEGRFEEAGRIATELAGGIRVDFAADINKESDSDFIIIIGSDLAKRQQVLVDVLNGNGIKEEARTIGRMLTDEGLTIRSTVNSDSHENERTVIKYKPGYVVAALFVSQAIRTKYPSIISEDISMGGGVDIALVLGLDGLTK